MKNIISWLKEEESGQGMVEYGLIIAGIAVVVMGAIFLLGPKISSLFTQVSDKLPAASAAAAT
jgi:pilus assembly protein Flp/PilA